MSDFECPIFIKHADGTRTQCGCSITRSETVFNNHMRIKHKGISREGRTRWRIRVFGDQLSINKQKKANRSAMSRENERAMARSLDIK